MTPTHALSTPAVPLDERFLRFLADPAVDGGIFAQDVVTRCNFPHVRFELRGAHETLARVREEADEGPGEIRHVRVDRTARGFVVEFERTLGNGATFQEIVRADVEGGRIAQLAWYCTGALQRHSSS